MPDPPPAPRGPTPTGLPTVGVTVAPAIGEAPGDQIGPYRLLSLIGEGGFGVVWLAERRDPIVQRVALKVIKPGMDSRAVVARFEQERQALALMDHPNIARVFDAGATPLGRPYFVMEHVKGEAITAYCDRNKLSVRKRLELFATVCEAVQHAHGKGIIHRDIKPSNVLVEAPDAGGSAGDGPGGSAPRPKIIDFGVAKAISHILTDKTVFTEQGQIVGTPEYMSPEQAEMGATDIDTRTDVYSLGVLLYELLTGALPFDARSLRSGGYAEIQRIIREVDPPRPSTRLSSLGDSAREVALRRNARLEELERELRRELEWIPLKAMRKDRDDRYRTPAEMADDVRNYLAGLPLRAGPESAAYRGRKFVRRHKGAVLAAGAVAAAVLIGAGVSVWFGVREARARREAAQQRDVLGAVNDFLNDDLLGAADPESMGPDVRVVQVLDRAGATLGEAFPDRPAVEARLRRTIGQAYMAVGRPELAIPHLDRARELYATGGPAADEASLDDVELLRGEATWRHGDAAASIPPLEAAIARASRTHDPDDPLLLRARNILAGGYKWAGRLDEAEAIYTDVLARRTRVLGPGHVDTLVTRHNIALLDRAQAARAAKAKDPTADAKFRAVLATTLQVEADTRRALGDDHPQSLAVGAEVARLLCETARCEECAAAYDRLLPRLRAVLGSGHWRTLETLANSGYFREKCGDGAGARAAYEEALAGYRDLHGPAHDGTVTIASWLAATLATSGDTAKAGEVLERTHQDLVAAGASAEKVREHAARAHDILLKAGDQAGADAWAGRAAAEPPNGP